MNKMKRKMIEQMLSVSNFAAVSNQTLLNE